jgi:hypothetical protein
MTYILKDLSNKQVEVYKELTSGTYYIATFRNTTYATEYLKLKFEIERLENKIQEAENILAEV